MGRLQGHWAVPTPETHLAYTGVGRVTTPPQRCPATHGCYLPCQVGAGRCDQGDGPGEEKVTLDHPGWPIYSHTSLNWRNFPGWRHREKVQHGDRKRPGIWQREDSACRAAVKREGGAVGSREAQPCQHLEVSPVRPLLGPGLQNYDIIHLHCLKLLVV